MFGRVFENHYSSGVEYYVKFWSGVEWSIEILEYYSSICSILRSRSGSIGGSEKVYFQKLFRKWTEIQRKNDFIIKTLECRCMLRYYDT